MLVYGGREYHAGQGRRTVDSGATYDPATGIWKDIPAAGFTEPLLQVGGVWTGKEVVVLGTPCKALADDDGEGLSGCSPGGVMAAAFSPVTHSWRTLGTVQPIPSGHKPGDLALTSTGLGWTGTEAAFLTQDGDNNDSVLLFDPETNRWRLAEGLDRSDSTCVVNGQVLAIVTGRVDAAGGIAAPSPTGAAEPLRIYELGPTTLDWSELSSTEKPDSKDASFERVYCGDGLLVYLPIKPAPVGYGRGGLWFDPPTSQWQAIPSLGDLGYPSDPSVAELNGEKVIMFRGGTTYFLPKGGTDWVQRPSPDDARGFLGTVGGLIVTLNTAPGDHSLPNLGFIDVPRYVRESPA